MKPPDDETWWKTMRLEERRGREGMEQRNDRIVIPGAYGLAIGRLIDCVDDEEAALTMAAWREDGWLAFYHVSARLKSDRAFMCRAMEVNGRVLRYAPPSMQQDKDMQVRAVANHYCALDRLSLGMNVFHRHMETVQEMQAFVKEKLDVHASFQPVLSAIALAEQSPLHLLNVDTETSQALKQLIAEYVGVPIGDDLGRLRCADESLVRAVEREKRPPLDIQKLIKERARQVRPPMRIDAEAMARARRRARTRPRGPPLDVEAAAVAIRQRRIRELGVHLESLTGSPAGTRQTTREAAGVD